MNLDVNEDDGGGDQSMIIESTETGQNQRKRNKKQIERIQVNPKFKSYYTEKVGEAGDNFNRDF